MLGLGLVESFAQLAGYFSVSFGLEVRKAAGVRGFVF